MFAHLNPRRSDFGDACALHPLSCTSTCVSVVVCGMCKLQPCLSNSRHRDHINLGLVYLLRQEGGGYSTLFLSACRLSTRVSFPSVGSAAALVLQRCCSCKRLVTLQIHSDCGDREGRAAGRGGGTGHWALGVLHSIRYPRPQTAPTPVVVVGGCSTALASATHSQATPVA